MRDLYFNTRVSELVVPAVLTTTPGSFPSIDLQGFKACELAIQVGAGGITFTGTNKIELVMEHSDDNSNWAAVTVSDVIGLSSVTSGIVAAYVAAKAASNVQKLGYRMSRRYIRLRPVFGGTHATGTAVAATAILGKPELSQDLT